MRMLKACVLASSSILAAGQTGSIGDVISAVQGHVQMHHQASASLEGEGATGGCNVAEDPQDVIDEKMAANTQLVVTRGAGEDLRWLDSIPEIRAVVYNRNGIDALLPQPRSNLLIVKQDNVAREDDAILRHIINNYFRLSDITIFTQGWPFWHCGGALEMIKRTLKNWPEPVDKDFIDSGAQPGLVPLASTFYQYSLTDNLLGTWNGIVMSERHDLNLSKQEIFQETKRSFNETCTAVLDRPCPAKHWLSEGAQWAVSSSRIRSRSLDYYKKLLGMTDKVGSEKAKSMKRGLVLESLWPGVWNSSDWTPSTALLGWAKKAVMFNSLKKVDAPASYCSFSTDRLTFATAGEKRGVCELEKHAAGESGSTPMLMAQEGSWSPTVQIRPVAMWVASKDDLVEGSKKFTASKPKPTYTTADTNNICSKRHLWTPNMITRLRNKETKQCLQVSRTGFIVEKCTEQAAETQMLHVLTMHNGGYVAIQDKYEVACLSHNIAVGASAKCSFGIDSGVVDQQKWELKQREGGYNLMAKGSHWCVNVKEGRLNPDRCESDAAVWELTDLPAFGQYHEKFDLALVEMTDGKIKRHCAMRLHSGKPKEATVDHLEPEWRQRGHLLYFQLTDAKNGAYYLGRRSPSGLMGYLSCDSTTKEATFTSTKTEWKIRPVSDAFVVLESEGGMLHTGEQGKVKCSEMVDGAPPEDATFAIEFQEKGKRSII